jgi:hypothetical protein
MNKSMQSIVLAALAKATSILPQAFSGVVDAVIELQPDATNDEIADALEKLADSSRIKVSRGQRGGIWQNLYWPNGRNQPEKPMSKSETLLRAIVKHGPIVASALAEETGIAAKGIDAILASPNTRNVVVTRLGFCAEKGRDLKHYMTTTQADEWDENVAAAGGDRDNPAAHVMSAPRIVAKQSEDEIPANVSVGENIADNAEVTALKIQIHGLLNDVAAANLIFSQIADMLNVTRPEHIPAALDDLTQALSTRAMQPDPELGRLALLLIDSADLTEIEELDTYDSANARQLAERSVEQGNASRAVVVRILGEAQRRVEWREAA